MKKRRHKRPPGPPKGSANALVHGISRTKRILRGRGLKAIDARTREGKQLFAFHQSLIDHRGGHGKISAVEKGLCDLAARQRFLLDRIDAYLVRALPDVIDETGKLHPLIRQRQGVANSLAMMLRTLGLDAVTVAGPPLLERYARSIEVPDDDDEGED